MAKFCANLAFMFTERPLLERYRLAKDVGFQAVETGFPFGLTQQEVVNAKNQAGLQQVLINVFTGDVTKGELGFTAIPGKEKEFKDSLELTVSYANALDVKKIHIMAGKIEGEPTPEHDQVYESNLRYAVTILKNQNILGVVEPINKYSVPNYYLNCYNKALKVIKTIDSPHLRLLLDVFHLQHISGNITNSIKELKEYIGHIQVAQVPYRNEPDTDGEINYEYVLKLLKNEGYDDWIGLEYKPAESVLSGIKWIEKFGYTL